MSVGYSVVPGVWNPCEGWLLCVVFVRGIRQTRLNSVLAISCYYSLRPQLVQDLETPMFVYLCDWL